MNHLVTDLNSLQHALTAGQTFSYLFFWGHQPSADGRITKTCLSQWWAAEFTVDGRTYATAEHYMMAEKARLFGDEATRAEIVQGTDPKEAKALGRKVQNFSSAVWDKARFEVVVQGNLAKFGQNPPLKQFLLETHPAVLVEASPYDRIWGIGLKESDPQALTPSSWQGLNLLGFALMQVRELLTQTG